MTSGYQSWGGYPRAAHRVLIPSCVSEVHPLIVDMGKGAGKGSGSGTVLPYGLGRSYGDSCLNDGGAVISTERLATILSFDADAGVIECEAGVPLEQVLNLTVLRGWFPAVSPGTKHVTIGGAIANDVHGKNHHRSGTFGRHVSELTLLRSDGSENRCSPEENPVLFNATVAGLGLTGFITRATLQLKKIPGSFIDVESIKCKNLDDFFRLSAESDRNYEHTVSWTDCLASGASLGKGIFMRGNHSLCKTTPPEPGRPWISVPFDLPAIALNRFSVCAFNLAYYHKQRQDEAQAVRHYEPFFYPLDAVKNWNRIYGRRGFLQFQCVVPTEHDNEALRTVLEAVVRTGKASFLAVLKEFSGLPSPGLLSFPRKGVTLCLDFPNAG